MPEHVKGVLMFVYFTAVVTAAWCGYAPGQLVVFLVVAIWPYAYRPRFSIRDLDLGGYVLFAAMALVVSWVSATRRKDVEQLAIANAELDDRVRRQTTALEEANAALERQLAALKIANHDLNQFAYIAAHDIQEPVRIIAIYSQLLERRLAQCGHLSPDAADFLGVISGASERMRNLVQDLFAYSRLIAEEGGFRTAMVDLNEAVEVAQSCCRELIAECNGNLEVEPLPTIRGDRSALISLFQNFLTNSIKYRSASPPRITIAAERQGQLWKVAIRDNGIGIRPEYHDLIFEVFKRLHGRDIPGTGIGLAICKKVVERHGGRIWVDSDVDRGATFYFTLEGTN